MTGPEASAQDSPCHYLHFGLIVTGRTEEKHLPKLFKSLMATGICHFAVIRRIGQRNPITSETRKLKMVGTGKTIPDKDEEEIGLPARKYLAVDDCRFVLLIDDLEPDRREQAQQVFDRYRTALDSILRDDQRKQRAAMHFLVNMLEAYYFADAKAINKALNLNPPIDDYEGDVEDIRNPKSRLKQLYPEFHESEDGGRILERIDIDHVLSRPDTCAWLRTLFAWCVKALEKCPNYQPSSEDHPYQLNGGSLSEITKPQINSL